jgi:hypothetical protein
MERRTNSSILSTRKTGRVNQLPVNGIRTMVLRSTLTSILFQLWDKEDTLITFQETSSSRHKMVERVNYGTSINHLELLDLERRTNQLISTTLVKETTCNTTQPHQDGGKCSSITMDTSPTSKMVEYSLLRTERILRLIQSMSKRDMVEETHPKSGKLSIPMLWEMKLMIRLVKPITNSDSRLTPHSYSDLDFQCKELWNATELLILLKRVTIRTEKLSFGHSIQYLRPSGTRTGPTMP